MPREFLRLHAARRISQIASEETAIRKMTLRNAKVGVMEIEKERRILEIAMAEEALGIAKAGGTSGIVTAEKTSETVKAEEISDISNGEKTSEIAMAEKTSGIAMAEETSETVKADEISEIAKVEETSAIETAEEILETVGVGGISEIAKAAEISETAKEEETLGIATAVEISETAKEEETLGIATAAEISANAEEEEEDADYTSLALPSARVRSFHPSSPRIDSAPPGQEYIREPRRYIQKVNEDAEWIYGSSVVEAALRSHAETNKRRKQLNRLYIYSGANRTPGNLDRDRQMQNLAKKVGVEVVWEKDVGKMDSMSNSRPHNGYVLEALPLEKTPVLSLEKVDTDKSTMRLRLAQHAPDDKIVINELSHEIACREPERRYPFLDPGNMGAMLRSAYYLGADAVVVSAKNCAPLSPVCLKASAGAAEFIPILEHAQGERFIKNSAENGWTFYAALPPQKDGQKKDGRYVLGSQVGEAVTKGPVVLVLGSEGEGLRQSLVKNVHYYISIDSAANTDKIVDSLNVSVASALLVSRFLQGN
ncbi:hypothetical protein RUND412_006229 [Rhizina undulata]